MEGSWNRYIFPAFKCWSKFIACFIYPPGSLNCIIRYLQYIFCLNFLITYAFSKYCCHWIFSWKIYNKISSAIYVISVMWLSQINLGTCVVCKNGYLSYCTVLSDSWKPPQQVTCTGNKIWQLFWLVPVYTAWHALVINQISWFWWYKYIVMMYCCTQEYLIMCSVSGPYLKRIDSYLPARMLRLPAWTSSFMF